MHRRPWPLVLISIFQILNIPASIIMSAYANHIPIVMMAKIIWLDSSRIALMQFFVMPFVLFYLVFSPRFWTFYIVIAMVALTVYQNIHDWVRFAHGGSLWALIVPNLFSLLFLTYLLLPRVRETFFNRSIRWWETKPRYVINHPGFIETQDGKTLDCMVGDIAEGGVGVDAPVADMPTGDFRFKFIYEGAGVTFNAKVVYSRPISESHKRYGIQWTSSTRDEKHRLHEILNTLKEKGVPVNRVMISWREDLQAWLARATTSLDAWMPEYRKPRGPAKPSSP